MHRASEQATNAASYRQCTACGRRDYSGPMIESVCGASTDERRLESHCRGILKPAVCGASSDDLTPPGSEGARKAAMEVALQIVAPLILTLHPVYPRAFWLALLQTIGGMIVQSCGPEATRLIFARLAAEAPAQAERCEQQRRLEAAAPGGHA